MTKRDVLLAICETPGWQPPEESSTIDRHVQELAADGWILPRLDGWEASPKALDNYPRFDDYPAIADPEPAPPAPEPADPAFIPVERVTALIAALLCEFPLVKVMVFTNLRLEQVKVDETTARLARGMAEAMAR
jgi:hypothetical protein